MPHCVIMGALGILGRRILCCRDSHCNGVLCGRKLRIKGSGSTSSPPPVKPLWSPRNASSRVQVFSRRYCLMWEQVAGHSLWKESLGPQLKQGCSPHGQVKNLVLKYSRECSKWLPVLSRRVTSSWVLLPRHYPENCMSTGGKSLGRTSWKIYWISYIEVMIWMRHENTKL